jgi:large subunit ribosomal protein L32e
MPSRTPHTPHTCHDCGHLQELELLLMQNRKYCAEIASAVSASKRREIVLRAEQLNVRVTNAHAKLREEENE